MQIEITHFEPFSHNDMPSLCALVDLVIDYGTNKIKVFNCGFFVDYGTGQTPISAWIDYPHDPIVRLDEETKQAIQDQCALKCRNLLIRDPKPICNAGGTGGGMFEECDRGMGFESCEDLPGPNYLPETNE